MSIEQCMKELTESNYYLAKVIKEGQGATVYEAPETIVVDPKKAKVVEPTPEPEPEVEVEVVENAAVEGAEAKAYTIEDVRAILGPVIAKHSPTVVSDALASMDVETLSDLSADRYTNLIQAVALATGETLG